MKVILICSYILHVQLLFQAIQRDVDENYSEMIVGHNPPIKLPKYRKADERMKASVERAVANWEDEVPMEYLAGIATNFRMAQGPYVKPKPSEAEGSASLRAFL